MQFPLFLVGRYYLSHALSIQLASIHIDSISTSSTVPGQMVMSVLRTNRVLKVIRLSAPMLRDDASEKRRLCSSRTRQTRYNRRNIGRDRMRSTGTSADVTVWLSSSCRSVHVKGKSPGIGWTMQMSSSTDAWTTVWAETAIRQSSMQLSMMNNCKQK